MFIKNHWYAVEFGAEVASEPVLARVHGHDLVLWRSHDGTVNAQSDLCVHRGGSLAGGKVVGNCVQCPYHGWRYGADGACVEIPANRHGLPIPRKARIDTYPCVERYGFVWFSWAWTLLLRARPPPLLCSYWAREHTRPTAGGFGRFIRGVPTWKCQLDRVLEETAGVTSPHTPFVHSGFVKGNGPRALEIGVDSQRGTAKAVFLASVMHGSTLSLPGVWAVEVHLTPTDPAPRVSTTIRHFYPPKQCRCLIVATLPMVEIRRSSPRQVPAARLVHARSSLSHATRPTFFTAGWGRQRNSMRARSRSSGGPADRGGAASRVVALRPVVRASCQVRLDPVGLPALAL